MKNTIKLLGIIALIAVIGFSITACDASDPELPEIASTVILAAGSWGVENDRRISNLPAATYVLVAGPQMDITGTSVFGVPTSGIMPDNFIGPLFGGTLAAPVGTAGAITAGTEVVGLANGMTYFVFRTDDPAVVAAPVASPGLFPAAAIAAADRRHRVINVTPASFTAVAGTTPASGVPGMPGNAFVIGDTPVGNNDTILIINIGRNFHANFSGPLAATGALQDWYADMANRHNGFLLWGALETDDRTHEVRISGLGANAAAVTANTAGVTVQTIAGQPYIIIRNLRETTTITFTYFPRPIELHYIP
ncbi:MAG: hypothetical protein FWD87_02825 [Spirochaetaceae bacterium]|nr:hypothetical protein [Spirochaetaceae bacterium]